MSSVPAPLLEARLERHGPRAWRIGGAVVAALAVVFLMYSPSSDSLFQLWRDTGKTTYTHGFIIAGLVGWLAFRRRDRLAELAWSPSIPAALCVLAAGLAWSVAVRAGIEIVHQLLLLALLWLSVWSLFGRRVAMELWLPIGFLVFAIPVWDQINFALQDATVFAVSLLLKISSIPAYVDGSTVHLAAGVFEVEGGCSGEHFLIVALALSTLYGEVNRDTWPVRLKLIALAISLALLTNWLRVYAIIVTGHLTHMQHYLIRKEHYTFGWMVFAVTMTVFFMLARRFKIAEHPPAPVFASPPNRNRRSVRLTIAVACVLAMPAWSFLHAAEPATLPASGALSPVAPHGWTRTLSADSSGWNPVFVGADRTERAEYTNASGAQVQSFVASYASQEQGKELVGYGNGLVGPDDGQVVRSERTIEDGAARELVVEGSSQRALIRYYYLVGSRRTVRGVVAQLWYGMSALRHGTAASVFALRAYCTDDCDGARALLDQFNTSGNRGTERP